MAHEKFTAAQIIKSANKNFGLVSVMAKDLGCDDDTIRRYIRKYPTVAKAITSQREALVDKAELSLRSAVTNVQPWAVALVLKTLGKDRDYVERQEVTGADNGPVLVKVIYDKQP